MSTVVDVTVCLLFVGAAATVVVNGTTVEKPAMGNPAADRAERLGTTTASVEYSLVVPGDPPDWEADPSARHRRTAHGTVAELLGEAALSRVEFDGQRLSNQGRRFEERVVATAESRLADNRHRHRGESHQPSTRDSTVRTAVRVRWTPYPGAPVTGALRFGERPPPDADVRAATLSVPSGFGDVDAAAHSAARTAGYDGVAHVVARTVVNGLFPPGRTQLALRGDYPEDRLMAAKYRRAARITGTRLDAQGLSVAERNRDLTTALAQRLRRDMAARFESPTAAAEAVETETVRLTVRTWSP